MKYQNDSHKTIPLPENQMVTLEAGAHIYNSIFYGGFYLERYSAVNRSSVWGPSGLGAFSYIADANIGPFVNIGSRVSIGGYEHPQSWLSTAAFQWVDKPNLLGNEIGHEDTKNLEVKPKSPTTQVEADVWIGSNVVVKAGLR